MNDFDKDFGRPSKKELGYIKDFFENPVVREMDFDENKIKEFYNSLSNGFMNSPEALLFTLFDSYDLDRGQAQLSAKQFLRDFDMHEAHLDELQRMLNGLTFNHKDLVDYKNTLGLDLLNLKDEKSVSKDGEKIQYQSDINTARQEAERELFTPTKEYLRHYNEVLNMALRENNPTGRLFQIADKTPFLYVMLGMPNRPLKMRQDILKKVISGKHEVSLKTMENFPELFCDPLMVLKSNTDKDNSLVAVLNAEDKNGKTVIAIIRKENGEYNIIPSVYGKNDIKNFIDKSEIIYADDKRTSKVTDISGVQFPDWNNRQTKSALTSRLTAVRENVKPQLKDEGAKVRGAMETLRDGRRIIRLFEAANASTFIHEAGHLFLSQLEDHADNEKIGKLLQQTRGWQEKEFDRLYRVKERDDGKFIVTDKKGLTIKPSA